MKRYNKTKAVDEALFVNSHYPNNFSSNSGVGTKLKPTSDYYDFSCLEQDVLSSDDVNCFEQDMPSSDDVNCFEQDMPSSDDVNCFEQDDQSKQIEDIGFPESIGLTPNKNLDALISRKLNMGHDDFYKNTCVIDDVIWGKDPSHAYYRPILNPTELNLYFQELQLVHNPCNYPEPLENKEVKRMFEYIKNSFKFHRYSKDFEDNDYLLPLKDYIVKVKDKKIKKIPYTETTAKFKYYIDAKYDTNAFGKRTTNFLNTFLTEDAKAHNRFWQAMGAILFPDPSTKSYVWFYGNGDDGKSTLVRFLRKIFISNITIIYETSISTLFSEHGPAYVKDAAVVVLTENNKMISSDQVCRLKAQTGGDYTQLNPKGKAMFNKRCTYKILVTSNHLPSFAPEAIDDALIRRTLFIKVYAPQKSEDKRPELIDWLYEERDYFITMAINGYSQWQANGNQFTNCEKDDYLKELVFSENPISEFLEQCCIMGSEYFESSKALKAAFKIWQKQNDQKIALSELQNFFVSKGYKLSRPMMSDGSRPHCVLGLKLK